MELKDSRAWQLANLLVLAFAIACAVVSLIPARPMWFGVVSDGQLQLVLSMLAGVCIYEITKRYVRAIDSYVPETQIQAKRANEQIKFSANFGNNVSTAWIGVVAISELTKTPHPNYYAIVVAVVIAGAIHAGSRNMIALIKDENFPAE